MPAPIEVHYWPTPNGWKISIFMEEAGLPYQIRFVNIGAGDQFEPEFLKIAPNNRMPAIVDPDGPGGEPISIFESGAILQYLGRKTGQFYPSDERARAEVDQWLFWQMGGVGPMAGQAHHFLQYAREDLPYAKQRYTDEVNRLYGVLNKRLADRDYVAGDYSIADMAHYPWARTYPWANVSVEGLPHLQAWFDRIDARHKTQDALQLPEPRPAYFGHGDLDAAAAVNSARFKD